MQTNNKQCDRNKKKNEISKFIIQVGAVNTCPQLLLMVLILYKNYCRTNAYNDQTNSDKLRTKYLQNNFGEYHR